MQITIKAHIGGDLGVSGLGLGSQGLKGLNSAASSLGSSVDKLSSTIDKLTSALTSMMFGGAQGLGASSKGLGMSNQLGQSFGNGAQGAGNLLSMPQSGSDALSKMFDKALDDLLGHDTVTKLTNQSNQLANSLLNASQMTQGNMNAFGSGVNNALSSILGNGLGQAMNGFSQPSLGAGGLQGLGGAGAFSQLGNAIGMGVGQNAALGALSNVSTHVDGNNRHFVDKEDRGMAKEIGQFMDQYPEIFGKPQYQKDNWSSAKTDDKSWAKALSKPDDDGMTGASMDKFRQAMGMIKSAVAGDTGNTNLNLRGAGGASLGIDAAVVGDKIANMALGKLANA
ncbi:Harpin family protein [Dickeya chrysanthemi Ech1591]|uniref:Harpin family protein n=1 Tax=Dickeya chrysanthemi (strain Ech1591) TaxID=561229 RepID=C6CGU7_DICC1|nr:MULTISPECIES: harpin HrpN [Dickeya]ACT06760.1 Harpin family protein [Dickeya chrysanthemi Ech1591]TYL41615.1 type III secretion protein HrpN [Dickeya sp. ws52]WJM84630.1 harpin HrpZ family protein [Dickeya chrysanthemi]